MDERILPNKKGNKNPIVSNSDLIYWLRFGFAILSALLCTFLRLGKEGLVVGIVIYVISYIVSRYLMRTSVNLGRYEVYVLGLGTYIVTWFTFWILTYTLFR